MPGEIRRPSTVTGGITTVKDDENAGHIVATAAAPISVAAATGVAAQ